MKILLKKTLQTSIICVCAVALVCSGDIVSAEDVESMENQSSELESQLDDINSELFDLGNEIAEVEEEIESTMGQIESTKEQLAIARYSEAKQYEDMKLRIKYMYENDSATLLAVLCDAKDMNDFLNKLDFIQNISEYDRNKLNDLRTLRDTIAEQEEYLTKEQDSQVKLQEELNSRKSELKVKADETSTDLESLKKQIKEIREEEARKAAEEKKRKEEEARKAAEASKNSSKGSGGYDMPSGDGVLTKQKGVNYYKGHRETYYSQRVLPGNGLNIPGRHVAADGTIRDEDNYICVASSDYPKGTIVETSLGMGKVYDSGCASGTIDIYTDW
ncbi:MAG: coiled-coil domain-containing protein [Lachnospiraceae bacterium]